jgi:hypothetical protein
VKRPHIRIQAAALAFILLPAATGVLAVHASATCERFVRTYVTKPVRNRVSKETADAWAKWRIGHPNWKPNPNLHRPKYVMTQDEVVHKVDFACAVPTEPMNLEVLLTPDDTELPPIVDLTPMEATQIDFPDLIPPEVAEIPPDNTSWPILAPFVPPVLGGNTPPPVVIPPPPAVVPTPEPSSILLVVTGLGSIGLLVGLKRNRPAAKRS